MLAVDERSRVAVFEPGIRLPEADAALRAHGLALGHVPQSYEWATVGGCAATRSAGQASTGHGRFDEQVVALECVTPAGSLATLDAPGTAAGPSLRQLVLGSEGAFGVITRVALRVRPLHELAFDGWTVGSFMEGAELLRGLEQGGIAPGHRAALRRARDGAERRAWRGPVGSRSRLIDGRCLLVCGWEGATGRAAAARALLRGGARPLAQAGPRLGARALRRPAPARRPAGPRRARRDARDRDLLEQPRAPLRRRAGRAERLPRRLPRLAPVSRAAPRCTSRCWARQGEDPVAQWTAAKDTVTRAIVAAGGTITHHHAVGRDHAPYLGAEVGEFGLELLRAVKERCDPAGIMNPGKVVDFAGARLS